MKYVESTRTNPSRGSSIVRRAAIALLAVAATGVLNSFAVAPSSAATSPATIYVGGCTANSVNVTDAQGGGSQVSEVSWTASTDRLTVVNDCAQDVYMKLFAGATEVLQLRITVFANNSQTTQTLGNSLTSMKIYLDSNYVTLAASLSAVAPGGGGGNTPSGSTPSAPVEVSMSLDLAASGASCKEGSAATGTVGQWLTLPGADDCTSTTRSDAKLLGWSTSKDFPVTIAQRQVSNGWGTYELTNDSGEVTAVFIPAGGATFVSSGNSLFPIWAR